VLSGAAGALAGAHDTTTRDDLKRALVQLEAVSNEYFEHPRSAKTQAYIEQQHERIRELAKTAPEERRLAHIIFRRGLSAEEFYEMSREFRLAVHEADLVFPDTAGDFESKVPMQSFWSGNDSSVQVLERSIAEHRAEFKARATELRRNPDPGAGRVARYFDQLAKKSRPVVPSVGVTAKLDMLRLVSEEPDIYAVVMDPSPDTVRRLDDMRDRMPGRTAILDIPEN
jgi:hypothetical protein